MFGGLFICLLGTFLVLFLQLEKIMVLLLSEALCSVYKSVRSKCWARYCCYSWLNNSLVNFQWPNAASSNIYSYCLIIFLYQPIPVSLNASAYRSWIWIYPSWKFSELLTWCSRMCCHWDTLKENRMEECADSQTASAVQDTD